PHTNRNHRPPRNEFFRCQVVPLRSKNRPEANKQTLSLLRRRFPEFNAVSFRVHDPAEVTELRLFGFWIDIHAFAAELGEDGVKIVDAVVDHERLIAWFEIIGVRFERRPNDVRLSLWLKIGACTFLQTD